MSAADASGESYNAISSSLGGSKESIHWMIESCAIAETQHVPFGASPCAPFDDDHQTLMMTSRPGFCFTIIVSVRYYLADA